MTDQPDPLAQFSAALVARAKAAANTVVAIRLAHERHLTLSAPGREGALPGSPCDSHP